MQNIEKKLQEIIDLLNNLKDRFEGLECEDVHVIEDELFQIRIKVIDIEKVINE